jgi:DNA polymerase III subunit epsilon
MRQSFATRLLVVDTESTGLDPAADRIVELAAVYFDERAYSSMRQMLIDPGIPIPKEAAEIHRITDERVRGKPRFGDVAEAFLRHVDGTDGPAPVLVGFNALTYDVPLINAELARHGVARRLDASRVVDPIFFIRHSLRHIRHRSLGAMCEHYGVSLKDAHRAGADARATGELLLRLVEAGVIPDDVEEALAQQQAHRSMVEAEWEEFSYWLFRDRADGALRLGAGKHCGVRLDEVDASYLEYLAKTIADLPAAVKLAFAARG